MTDDDRYDDEELAQARALAAALEHGPPFDRPDTAPVGDALDAAALITAARQPGLSEARLDAVLQSVTERVQAARRRVRRRLAIGFGVGGSLAAAAALMLAVLSPVARDAHAPSQTAEEPSAVATGGSAPAPGAADAARAELTAAQLAWLDDPEPNRTAILEARLASYRAAHLSALHRRYGR